MLREMPHQAAARLAEIQTMLTLWCGRAWKLLTLRLMVAAADTDKSGFLDKQEFLALVARQWEHLEEVERSKFKQYLRVAAYADHYRWWPPPLFTIATVLILTVVHIHHSVLLASQPPPLPHDQLQRECTSHLPTANSRSLPS